MRLVLAALLSLAIATPAAAEDAASSHTDLENRFCIEPPDAFQALPRDESSPPLAMSGPKGAALVVSRIEHPNRPAWRRHRERFFDQIIKGLQEGRGKSSVRGRKYERIDGIPALTLSLREAKRTIETRFLFYRRYALSASIELPSNSSRAQRRAAQRAIKSFRPCKKD